MRVAGKKIIGSVLQSRVFFFVLIILTAISLIRLGDEIMRRVKISAQITKLKTEIKDLREQHQELSALTNYLSTDAYIDEVGREKLNLRKPGERVYLVQDDETSTKTSKANSTNPKLWFDYFTR